MRVKGKFVERSISAMNRVVDPSASTLASGQSASNEQSEAGALQQLSNAPIMLHTREGWLKEARDVRLEDIDRHAKLAKKREDQKARKRRHDMAGSLKTSQKQSSLENASFSAGARSVSTWGVCRLSSRTKCRKKNKFTGAGRLYRMSRPPRAIRTCRRTS